MRVIVLLTSQQFGETETQTTEKTDSVEVLRQILVTQGQREVSYVEAQEIGDSLIEFYQVLAEEVCDDSAD